MRTAKEKNNKITASFPASLIKIAALGFLGVILLFFSLAGIASANEPWWHLTSTTAPANLPPEGRGTILVTAANLGDADASGATTPITITDTLPTGLKAIAMGGDAGGENKEHSGGPVTCPTSKELKEGAALACTFTGVLPPYEQIRIFIVVEVEEGAASGAVNQAGVSGGEAYACNEVGTNAGKYTNSVCSAAGTGTFEKQLSGRPLPGASVARPLTISEVEPKFGVENYEMTPEETGGAVDTQAGSHPFQLTTTLDLNQTAEETKPPALAKDLNFILPPGLIGNPTVFPQCPEAKFLQEDDIIDSCPADSAMGVVTVRFVLTGLFIGTQTLVETVPLFNLTPRVGEPARFGFYVQKTPTYLDTSVRTGGDYGVTVSVDNIPENITFISSQVTFWGVPGDPRHDNSRGWSCVGGEYFRPVIEKLPPCASVNQENPPPFLALPTSCTGPLQTSMEADSWKEPGLFQTFSQNPIDPLPALDGCNDLPFKPEVRVSPDVPEASKPSGLKVDVHVPQSVDLDAEGLSASDVKNIVVALPAGVAINPSSGDGLEACSGDPGDLAAGTLGSPGDEIGYEGIGGGAWCELSGVLAEAAGQRGCARSR